VVSDTLAWPVFRVKDHRWAIFSVVYLLARCLLGYLMVLARREEFPVLWLWDGSLAARGAEVIITADGAIHLKHGRWQATILPGPFDSPRPWWLERTRYRGTVRSRSLGHAITL
jgi:hypothetical protein